MKRILLFSIMFIFIGCSKYEPKLPNNNEYKNISINELMNIIEAIKLDNTLFGISVKMEKTKEKYIVNPLEKLCIANNGNINTLTQKTKVFKSKKMKEFLNTPSFYEIYKYCKINDEIKFSYLERKFFTKNKEGYSFLIDTNPDILQIKAHVKEDLVKTQKINELKTNSKRNKELEIKKINQLKNRKGQVFMTFYTKFQNISGTYHYDLYCIEQCEKRNLNNNGYLNIESTIDDNWQFVSKIENVSYKIEELCICSGSKFLFKK